MEPISIALTVIALVIGAAAAWLARNGEIARLTAARDAERERAESLGRDLEAERIALAAARTRLEATSGMREAIDKDLKALADQALKENQASFLTIANEVMDKRFKLAAGDLDQRQAAIRSLVEPMEKSLAEYRKNLHEIEQSRKQAYGSLSAEIRNVAEAQERVRTEASRLVNALRAAPRSSGRWGEETLRNILELSGMTAHCDFVVEPTIGGEAGPQRPDVIIRLPGGGQLVVDAKTPLSAYMDGIDAVDDQEREAHMVRHAKLLREHMRSLASKAYQDAIELSPDYVVMFVAGDSFYAAAMERDPALYSDAFRRRVIIVSPSTMLGLAKSVAFGWRQEGVAHNARQIADLGRELYGRLANMGEHVATLGRDIERSAKSYNSLLGNLESRVMPQARRFSDLDVEGAETGIADFIPIETDVRPPREDRDLVVGPHSRQGAAAE